MKYMFIPTLDTVRVTFGTEFAFASLGRRATEMLLPEPEPIPDEEGNEWSRAFRFRSFIPTLHSVKTDHMRPGDTLTTAVRREGLAAKRSTAIVISGAAPLCLGCFLFARKLKEARQADEDDDETDTLISNSGLYLAVFPLHERRIATIDSMQPMYCAACEDGYRATGVWHEAGVHCNGLTQHLVSPVLVPFYAGRFAQLARYNELRDSMYLGYWPWVISAADAARLRPFRQSSFADALDALEAVALYQDDKQIRQLGHQVARRLEVLLISAYRDVETRELLDASVMNAEWVGAERFVVQFLVRVWNPSDSRQGPFKRSLTDAALLAAGGMPVLLPAKTRLARVINAVLRRAEPVHTQHFLGVVQATCRDFRVVSYGDVMLLILDAATVPQVLDAGSEYTVSETDSDSDGTDALIVGVECLSLDVPAADSLETKRILREARNPMQPIIGLHGLQYNADSFAAPALMPGRASLVVQYDDDHKPVQSASMLKLKEDLYLIESRRVRGDRGPSRAVFVEPAIGLIKAQLDVKLVVLQLDPSKKTPYHVSSSLEGSETQTPTLVVMPERAGHDTPLVYAYIQPGRDKRNDRSVLRLFQVIPDEPLFAFDDLADFGVRPFLRGFQPLPGQQHEWEEHDVQYITTRLSAMLKPTTGPRLPFYPVMQEPNPNANNPLLSMTNGWTRVDRISHTLGLVPSRLVLLSPLPLIDIEPGNQTAPTSPLEALVRVGIANDDRPALADVGMGIDADERRLLQWQRTSLDAIGTVIVQTWSEPSDTKTQRIGRVVDEQRLIFDSLMTPEMWRRIAHVYIDHFETPQAQEQSDDPVGVTPFVGVFILNTTLITALHDSLFRWHPHGVKVRIESSRDSRDDESYTTMTDDDDFDSARESQDNSPGNSEFGSFSDSDEEFDSADELNDPPPPPPLPPVIPPRDRASRSLLQDVVDERRRRVLWHVVRQRVLALSTAEMQRRRGLYGRFNKIPTVYVREYADSTHSYSDKHVTKSSSLSHVTLTSHITRRLQKDVQLLAQHYSVPNGEAVGDGSFIHRAHLNIEKIIVKLRATPEDNPERLWFRSHRIAGINARRQPRNTNGPVVVLQATTVAV
jgi:hypothetical protein